MHKFLQAHADSTLVLEYTSNWLHSPAYQLLSKKGDTITCYFYADLNYTGTGHTQVPQSIRKSLYTSDIFIKPVDINAYFHVYPMQQQQAKEFWQQVAKHRPWLIHDDAQDGTGCPVDKNKNRQSISDGGGIRLYLITKAAINILDFYAPDFYEKVCPGRDGRRAILQISTMFNSRFN